MKNLNNQKSCCSQINLKKEKVSFFTGLLYGILPHTFCIAFVIFSVIGATTATLFFKKFLLNPYFFHILVVLSFIFATISAIFYLKRNGILSIHGIKRKWRYLLTLYGTTIFINLLLFMVIFPIVANLNSGLTLTAAVISAFGRGEPQLSEIGSLITLQVAIPCPGHAPLIIGELKEIAGVESVKFRFSNLFDVTYDPDKTSKEKILSLDVFNTYKATVKAELTNLTTAETNNLKPVNNPSSQNSNTFRNGCTGGCGCGCGTR